MSQKFYLADNCNRTISHKGIAVNFTPYEHVGNWLGVHKTADAKEIEALDDLVGQKKLHAIDEEEYKRCLKKKGIATEGYSNSLAASAPTPGQAAPSAAPIPVNTLPELPAPDSKPLENADEAINPVPVEKKSEVTQ